MTDKEVIVQKAPLTESELYEKENQQALEESLGQAVNLSEASAKDIIALTARLAQVLAKEADLLERMQVSDIAPLQKEKHLLAQALETIKKQLPEDGSFMDSLEESEAEDLQSVILVFNEILEENYKRINMARMVNQRIVEAITDAVKEQSNQDVYDQKGKSGKGLKDALSVSLDKKI